MPFTPFHMGAALLVKPAVSRRFSVMTFGIAQVAMDIEPGVRMAAGTEVLHGVTHTILGALVMAFLVMLIAPGICNCLLAKWNKEVIHYKMPGLAHSGTVSKTSVIFGAFFGTLSHVVLDGLVHQDIHPLSPFSQANPFMGMITHDGVYQVCTIAGVSGVAGWLAIKWAGRTPQSKVGRVAPKPSSKGTSEGIFTLWVKELCITWAGVLLLTVVPAVLFGSGIFSIGILAVAVLIGIPSAALGSAATKSSGKRNLRRLAVMLVLPALTLGYVSQVDEQIPENATPLTQAIQSFRRETGHYPDTLEALIPKHLAKLPDVRFSVIQPLITYRITDGKPYLTIPSASGDMFAQFEYDFEAKAWLHQS